MVAIWVLRIVPQQSDEISIGQLNSGDLVYLRKKDWQLGHSFVFLDEDISLSMNGSGQSFAFHTTASILEDYEYPKNSLKISPNADFPIRIIRKKAHWQYPKMITLNIKALYDFEHSEQESNLTNIKKVAKIFHAYALQPDLSPIESEAAQETFHALTEGLVPQEITTPLLILSPFEQFIEQNSLDKSDFNFSYLDELFELTFNLIYEKANRRQNQSEIVLDWMDNKIEPNDPLRTIIEDILFDHFLSTGQIEAVQKLPSRKALNSPFIEHYCNKLIQSNRADDADNLASNYLKGTSRDSILQKSAVSSICEKSWRKSLITSRKIENIHCRLITLNNLVNSLTKDQLWDTARKILKEMKKLDEDQNLYSNALYNFSLELMEANLWDAAKIAIDELVMLKSNLADLVLMHYSIKLSHANLFDQAQQAAESIATDCLEQVSAFEELSCCLEKAGELQKAEEINLRIKQMRQDLLSFAIDLFS